MPILNEEVSAVITATLVDELGDAIPGSALEVLLLSVHADDEEDNPIRSSDDALNDSNITISEAGELVWNVEPYETEFVDRAAEIGDTENHKVLFEAAWNSPDVGSLVNPFATVADSDLVTVNHNGHGLSVNHHAYFVTESNVGGLDLGGLYIVREVIDSDSYKIQHRSTADAAATGGGAVDYFYRGKAGKFTTSFKIKRVDPN